ncbi:LSR2-like protein (plasmid) [Pseudarthrobacter chlorophenolicus A6]|uniref:LSR2-like protein n=1 Tax=Pseudarthrobacter chlorophenolicus (strain ATCC 700700 / DSM 12829 / CIP 107037 / JCM 12360 / KCTC 9906 / NCIMB 13794 / A6) TaxID=452863 RepID=B8HJB5_PSECP|nr:Lsr2 family protein [Pseudarthrobacter chlorophenolicus]ACL42513.1 LSR2-like protein [Pseudarthrobacter chlorophenolicus A6]SDQ10346.1 Lsr2 protein [Pseudarthrobacter chlorophenolicus]
MAKKTVVLLEDDIDGSKATETLSFALDGSEYEIDLNEGHANELRDALARFTEAGRKVAGGRGRPAVRTKSSHGGPDAKAVRMWAAENGIQVNTRGRIQADVVEKYEAAH